MTRSSVGWIGTGAVVGAGAAVTRDFAAGNPCPTLPSLDDGGPA
jgi:acetyltransferase-like isoleucine patch superfamily enzyme